MTNLLGLIGATSPTFFRDKFRQIIDKHNYAWYGWTIPLRIETLRILKKQIDDLGHFNLYGYSSSWPERNAHPTHRVEVVFTIKRYPVSHWDTRTDGNPCPEREKGIQGYDDHYLIARESGHGKSGNVVLPRKTWFAVSNAVNHIRELTEANFAPWDSRHKIHPSALKCNFIDIRENV